MHVPAICIAGWSDSGKTTLIERLIPLLTARGLRVGVVKHTHHALEMDKPGSDTDRYRSAGASAMALAAPDGTGVLDARPARLTEALAALHNVDLILVEGFDQEACLPALEVWRTPETPMRSREQWRRAVITDLPCEGPLPVFSSSATDSIADFLLTLAEEQRQRAVPGLSVSLDGQALYLAPFVQRMLAGALDGMLRTLDGYHEGCEITLRMKSKA